ncbi:hypothetical protein [Actinomyces slackii]|uniref:Uncharacterized protein n=1 Tax=Actinomyces slackii TaxID=52774 RepID=A0A3S4U1D1_9ACTO|nr:hypothetical protein [Actinomyces slackii]VEG74067.1 Uncharacterised protein [Actinomyces slackii]
MLLIATLIQWRAGELPGDFREDTTALVILAGFIGILFVRLPHLKPPGHHLRNDVILLSAPIVAAVILCIPLVNPWWAAYQADGTRLRLPLQIGASIVLLGIGWTMFRAREIHLALLASAKPLRSPRIRTRESYMVLYPPLLATLASSKGAGTDEEAHDSEPRLADAVEQTATLPHAKPLTWIPLLLAACAPAAAVALVIALVGAAIPSPDLSFRAIQNPADPVSEGSLPTTPTTAPTRVAWSTTLMATGRMSLAAGARGPIMLTAEGVRALNGEDGSLLWSYQISDGSYARSELDSTYVLVSSPDRRHVAVLVRTVDKRFESIVGFTAVVLDTITGTVTAQRRITTTDASGPTPALQLTDSAALLGTDVFSLKDGALLERFTSEELVPDENDTGTAYTGTAGHSTFMMRNYGDDPERTDYLLVPDSDLSRRIGLGNVCGQYAIKAYGPIIEAGWTSLCTADGQGSDSDQRLWTMTAVNIDEIAAAMPARDVEQPEDVAAESRVHLGTGLGPGRLASTVAGTLIMLTPAEHATDNGEGHTASRIVPQTDTALDPVTRTAVPANQSTSMGTALFFLYGPAYGQAVSDTVLTVAPSNGAQPLAIPLAPTEIYGSWRIMDEPPRSLVEDFSWDLFNVQALSAPGASTLVLETSHEGVSDRPAEITIVGVK